MAKPGSVFLQRWYDNYRNFSDEGWTKFSTQYGGYLMKLPEMQPHIRLLQPETMYRPYWRDVRRKIMI